MNLGLPELPDLHNVSLLLDGTTDQYVWYHSPAYWRADDVTGPVTGGERHLRRRRRDLPVELRGQPAHPDHRRGAGAAAARRGPAAARAGPAAAGHRGPRGPDLAAARPPDRRGGRGGPAAGPHRAGTTVGSVQIWADPASGLPVQVQITGRGTAGHPGQAVLLSTFLELSRTQPDLTPSPRIRRRTSGLTTTRLPDVDGVLNGDGDGDHDGDPFPPQLGGLRHVALPGSPPGVAIYGSGLLPLRAAAAAQRGRYGRGQLRDPGRGGQRRAARDPREARREPRPAC